MSAGPSFRFRPRVFELDSAATPHRALARLAHHRLPFLLDGAAGEPLDFSLLAFDPLPPPPRANGARWHEPLRELLRGLVLEGGDPLPGRFHGGLLCALAYDLGVPGERALPREPEPFGFPPCVGGLYVDFLVRDERAGRNYLVLGEEPGDGRDALEPRRRRICAELASPEPSDSPRTHATRRHTPAALHRERVQRLREAIGRGDLYQANLAHRFSADVEGSPEAWYARLRESNPAPYMGYARWRESDGCAPSGALLCSSPELFFESRGGEARTRPIKGTAARSEDPTLDACRARELLSSEKDLAELAMIVDLERNDLGRCAVAGGVRVEGWPTLQSHARVHHLMADVVARLRDCVDAFDVLAALFPGGSISGAPKLAALERIAALEGHGRGFFTGSMGFVDLRGEACFNILIRTLLYRDRPRPEVSFQVGGGITWASDPAAEERETLAKAAALLAALGSEPSAA